MLHVLTQLLQTDVLIAVELDPNAADRRSRFRVLLGRYGGVFGEHLLARLAGEVEARAAVIALVQVQYGRSLVVAYSGSPSARPYLSANSSRDMLMSSSGTW